MLYARALDQGAFYSPDSLCLVSESVRYTFRQAVNESWRMARLLKSLRLGPEERIAILSQNDARSVLLLIAAIRAGVPYYVMNTRDTPLVYADLLRKANVVVIFHDALHAEAVRETIRHGTSLREVICFDVDTEMPSMKTRCASLSEEAGEIGYIEPPFSVLKATGGTSGLAKIVTMSLRGLEAGYAGAQLALAPIKPNTVYLAAAPISHFAQSPIFPVMSKGGLTVLLPNSDPARILDAIEQWNVNITFFPPALLYKVLSSRGVRDRRLSSLRLLILAGAPVAPARLREAIEVFGPVLAQLYAQTESLSPVTWFAPEDHLDPTSGLAASDSRLGSAGRPNPLADVGVMDEDGTLLPPGVTGEIVVRGPHLMLGYLNNPAETANALRGGWLHTGDIGRFDDAGFLYLLDRKSDMIISGGFNVYPSEIERVILQLVEVEDCAVVGVPDERWGEAIKAVIELKPGNSISADLVVERCRVALGGVKAPKSVDFVEALPRSAVGKVLRREVRAKYWAAQARLIA